MIPILIFSLGTQRWALLIEDVLEVAAMVAYLPVPDAPPQVLGVVNRHGVVVPLLDLRLVFGQPAEPVNTTSLFIVAVHGGRTVGLVVDEIHHVEYIQSIEFDETRAAGKYIRGIISYKSELMQIISPAPLFTAFLSSEIEGHSD